jgi:DNA-binding GntR family transcriptional regulator
MSHSVICQIGREIFHVRPDDIEEIHRIREFCEQICLEKVEQLLTEKYPDQVIEITV